MNKAEIVTKYNELMKKHKLSKKEILFENDNISRWFDSCQEATLDDLRAKEEYLQSLLIGCSSFDKDQSYYECRSVFREILQHFIDAGGQTKEN